MASSDHHRLESRDALSRVLRAGLTTAIVDGMFSSVLNVAAYGSTVSRLFQGVAATLIGNSGLTGNAWTTALDVLMHSGVAFAWSAVFVFVVMRSDRIRRLLAARYGVVRVASAYGPAIWLVMSLVVIPALLQRPPSITFRWWVQFFGHIPFVGFPIVALGSRSASRQRSARSVRQVAVTHPQS
jgi:uncharacterized membrane protein YagU involved in acid resistance